MLEIHKGILQRIALHSIRPIEKMVIEYLESILHSPAIVYTVISSASADADSNSRILKSSYKKWKIKKSGSKPPI